MSGNQLHQIPGTLSRRGFLAASAGAGWAVLAHPSAFSEPVSASSRIRVGLIGCGRQGMRHLFALRQLRENGLPVEVVAISEVFGPRKDHAQALSGAMSYNRWETLVSRKDIDAVIIATPDHAHAPIALAVLQTGKDIYLEPPLALNDEDIFPLRSAVESSHQIFHVASPALHDLRWDTVRRLAQEGVLGSLRWSQFNVPYYPWEACRNESGAFTQWSRYRAYSGGVMSWALYDRLMPLLAVTGDHIPMRVSTMGGIFNEGDGDLPDAFSATLEYAAGHTVVLVAEPSPLRQERTVIRGDRASVRFAEGELLLTPEGSSSNTSTVKTGCLWEEQAAADLRHWIKCIQRRERNTTSFTLACDVQTALHKTWSAYTSGRTVLEVPSRPASAQYT